MTNKISHLILRKSSVKEDWKFKEKGGRKVLVNKMYPDECDATKPEWEGGSKYTKTPVVETGCGGLEVSTCTQDTKQDYHEHHLCTEIYTILYGEMNIKIKDETIKLTCGDEIIVFPYTAHQVLNNNGSAFLTRVHSINCHGDNDKYIL